MSEALFATRSQTAVELTLDDFEIAFLDADDAFCHIKRNDGRFFCGLGSGPRHAAGLWDGGKTCPVCATTVCPDCWIVWKEEGGVIAGRY